MTTYKKNIGVDAGLVWIGDPCYVMGSDASHGPNNWSHFCDRLFSEQAVSNEAAFICEPLGAGIGVAIPSGYGDGYYTVTVETTKDTGGWGERVKAVTVSFEDEVEPQSWED